jgi:hypothetical protein
MGPRGLNFETLGGLPIALEQGKPSEAGTKKIPVEREQRDIFHTGEPQMVRSRLLAVSVMLIAALCATTTKAELLIGVAGPMTGKDAWMGEQFQRGAELAVADLNAKGGVLEQQMQLIPDCHDQAKKQHAAWFRKVPEACSWCGYGASARTSRVRVGKAYICRSCTEEISRMRSMAGV